MNISNAEFSNNSMGTIRTGLAAFNNPVGGLIKSASTSTCCANENLNQKNCRNKNLIKDDYHYKRFVIEPSLLHLEKSSNEKSVDKNLQNKQSLRNNRQPDAQEWFNWREKFSNNFSKKENENVNNEFHTHSGLNKILVNEKNNKRVINFALANDSSMNIHPDEDQSNTNHSEISDFQEPSSEGKDSSQPSDTVVCSELSCLHIVDTNKRSNEEIKIASSEQHLRVYERNYENGISPTPNHRIVELKEASDGANEDEQRSNNSSPNESKPTPKPENGENFLARLDSASEPATTGAAERKERNADKPFRRSSSLKIHKECASTPAQKKIVRFADVLGLDLIDVRTFLDELPSVPKSAYDDLKNEQLSLAESPPKVFGLPQASETKSLVPTFTPPAKSPDFLDRIRDNYVCLESASVFNTPVCHITGTVRVRNLDFYKSVYVRYTSDNWKTFTDVQASYAPDSCDGFSDKFAFVIYVYTVAVGQRIELALRYHCCGSIFWDNNNGNNYVFQCFPSTPSMPSYFQCLSPNSDHCNSFY